MGTARCQYGRTMIGHHTCHGGYDWMDDTRFRRSKYGLGSMMRRFLDWMDWWLPEAWNVEHNKLHHYKLGERADPDLVEDNLSYLRDLRAPTALKRLGVGVIMCIWKARPPTRKSDGISPSCLSPFIAVHTLPPSARACLGCAPRPGTLGGRELE